MKTPFNDCAVKYTHAHYSVYAFVRLVLVFLKDGILILCCHTHRAQFSTVVLFAMLGPDTALGDPNLCYNLQSRNVILCSIM